MPRTLLAVLGAGLAVSGAGGVAVAGAATAPGFGSGYVSTPELAAARLNGSYAVSGVVTTAVGIPGERAGQRVIRSWTFISPCPTGACPTLGLRRQRVGSTDGVFLHSVAPGVYEGAGRYPAPVRCHGRTYPAGASVPYRLRVFVTAAALSPTGGVVATAFAATYIGGAHIGLTRCFQPPVHDGAAYSGSLAGS